MLNYSFIWKQTIIKHPLYMPSTIVYYRDTEVKKIDKNFCPAAFISGGGQIKQMINISYTCVTI